ncbi:uncharacterized protein LOC119602971 [Lucilia sericata]|uniref:uncharacterized protein LOC119602971 n=1 Tax=Lucilia sericata TaxID=13632 RepID=UPI0018A7F281|nr:uncharacterized protein LOC119602971 [Lucilia sericata]
MDTKAFWIEFLEIYHSHPALWRFKSKEYKNKTLKEEAYIILIEKMKELYPEANKDMVLKKINTFRSSYRREKRKVQNSMRNGSSKDNIYKPKWFFFDKLKFLDEQYGAKVITPSMHDVEREDEGSLVEQLIALAEGFLAKKENSYEDDAAVEELLIIIFIYFLLKEKDEGSLVEQLIALAEGFLDKEENSYEDDAAVEELLITIFIYFLLKDKVSRF